METKDQPAVESAPVNDTSAQRELAEFVRDNRQVLPEVPRATEFPSLAFVTPEAQAALCEREARTALRALGRQKADIVTRGIDLVRAAGHRYRECTLENFRCDHPAQKSVLSNVLAYVAADCPENLILYGPVGTGKDHLAFAVAREAVKSGKVVKWINGQTWFGLVRDAMDTTKSEASLVSDLARPDLLCLSDPVPPVGALTQHQATMLYRVIDARYSRGVPTVCTVNVGSDAEADERMGVATWDRLCHGAYKLRCQWPSFRKPTHQS